MSRIPAAWRNHLTGFPPALLALLEAEVAAGNEILEVASVFPAPPAGACVRLSRAVTTRPRRDAEGIRVLGPAGSLHGGGFSDARGLHFLLEPASAPAPASADAFSRFAASLAIDAEAWRDGTGYDLGALREAPPEGRARIESLLLGRGVRDWRDVEALAALDTPRAQAALREAASSDDAAVRMAVLSHAPHLVPEARRTASLVAALREAEFYGGLTQALDEAARHHPPEVVDALLRGTLARRGEVAVHFAALLFHVHGVTAEPFAWSERPFFLRFHTEDRGEREAAFRALCERIGVDAAPYLGGP